jgi:hypothetical protein
MLRLLQELAPTPFPSKEHMSFNDNEIGLAKFGNHLKSIPLKFLLFLS